MESTIIYGKNAVIEALEAGEREFNKILISNSARNDVKIERIKERYCLPVCSTSKIKPARARRSTSRCYCTDFAS